MKVTHVANKIARIPHLQNTAKCAGIYRHTDQLLVRVLYANFVYASEFPLTDVVGGGGKDVIGKLFASIFFFRT